ncbi:hypothetical protein HPB48_022098 [Haemaphysalis longicornis]|uniref:Uncharacterized protein n=1 Tax=Haemaphysalis longicornis TaxID=44386 RepID=A0A9J6FWT1_HAELO|nr:hypothetical protein HPB48_022098 [Haemaphysalis longicornis]
MTWMIHRVDGMPSNIMVGDTAHCILLSISWLPREEVSKLLKAFFVTQKKGSVLTFVGHEHDRVAIICSGIVKLDSLVSTHLSLKRSTATAIKSKCGVRLAKELQKPDVFSAT